MRMLGGRSLLLDEGTSVHTCAGGGTAQPGETLERLGRQCSDKDFR